MSFDAGLMSSELPITAVIAELKSVLRRQGAAVLQAPPGAGKSTVVPLALSDEPWARGKRILMLEPRRLATRAVAERMARTLGERVGETVGYRMRLDTRVSRATRIEVVTEGIFTRLLQSDPALEGVAAVIFDEFHERSLEADLGLALLLDARENIAPDLKLLIMSATLDGESVSRLLDNAPLITAQGRMFPVETRFAAKGAPLLPLLPGGPRTPGVQESPERTAAQIVQRALREEPGDILVFLPGAREIRRVQSLLEGRGIDPAVRVFPLFGELSGEDQDAALAPSPRGRRKIVLATNIAETSLTIEGVRVVVDSGLVRRSSFDPSTGMSRLETRRISRASAEQRQGRAGRLEPGVCYRAWSEGAHRSLAPFTPPEIAEADLAPLALELASWGVEDATSLRWLDPPPAAMLASARDLLVRLGALDIEGRITPHGREMARIGAHPRLAHMLLEARKLELPSLAAALAALLSERDLLRGTGPSRDVDIHSRLEVIRGESDAAHIDRAALQRARRVMKDYICQMDRQMDRQNGDRRLEDRRAGEPSPGASATASRYADSADSSAAGLLLAFAYPDRIGRRRAGQEGRYTLSNGRGAYFAEAQGLSRHEFIVVIDVDDRERDARILLAAPLTRPDIEAHFADRIEHLESVEWNSREQAVHARRFTRLDSIVLEEKPLNEPAPEAARRAMLAGIRELGIAALPWTSEARNIQARIELVRRVQMDGVSMGTGRSFKSDAGEWPEVSDAALVSTLDEWLSPWLEGITRKEHLSRLKLGDVLLGLLSYPQQRLLDEWAPAYLEMPTGSRIRIDYLDDSAPVVSVRLQEVFGLQETPRLVQGRVPVTFKLLSPAQRPVQVTRDLAGFWRGSYAEVRKDLRGRYPKHHWPTLQELDNNLKRKGST